jgi:hypothetical protein
MIFGATPRPENCPPDEHQSSRYSMKSWQNQGQITQPGRVLRRPASLVNGVPAGVGLSEGVRRIPHTILA